MLDTNIKKNINNENTQIFSNRINATKPSNHQISIPNIALPLRIKSSKSSHKICKHFGDFQHALHMLKVSVGELRRLELEQLSNQKSTSPNSSNMRFDLQVPSIYTCRAVLPIASQIIPSQTQISSKISSPIIFQSNSTAPVPKIMSNKMGIKEKMSQQSNTSSVSSKQKSNRSLLSIPNKKQRRYESGDNFTKYSTKKALLHLKFHCSKHTH